jgi:hypothetical protein
VHEVTLFFPFFHQCQLLFFLTPWIKQSFNLGEKDFSILPRLLGKTNYTPLFPQNDFPLLNQRVKHRERCKIVKSVTPSGKI